MHLPLVLPGPAQGLRALLDRRAAEAGFALSVPFEADSTYTIKGLVAAGAGYSILSAHAVRNEVAAGTLAIAPIGAPGISRSVQLATGQGRRGRDHPRGGGGKSVAISFFPMDLPAGDA